MTHVPKRTIRRTPCTGLFRSIGSCLIAVILLSTPACTPADSAIDVEPPPESPPPPATIGLDDASMEGAFAEAAEIPRLRTLLVARHGEIMAELHVSGPPPDVPVNIKSVSKSVISALVGIAIDEGHLSGAGQPIAPFFEEYLDPELDRTKRRITIGHLLSMQSGLERTSGDNYGPWVTSSNWVRYAITADVVAEPGGRRLYSTGNSHLISAILTQATGESTWSFARSRLADPLGISLSPWLADPQGIYFGGNDMLMSPRAMVRFGELYRNEGRLEGKQIVPAWWVRDSLSPKTRARRPGEGYGYSWFLSQARGHDMFYAWGYGGQFIFVIPDLELTVVSTADTNVSRGGSHLRNIREILEDWIVPAAEVGAA